MSGDEVELGALSVPLVVKVPYVATRWSVPGKAASPMDGGVELADPAAGMEYAGVKEVWSVELRPVMSAPCGTSPPSVAGTVTRGSIGRYSVDWVPPFVVPFS